MERQGAAMKIEFRDGQPVVDATEIAPLLELDVPDFQNLMRSGRIRSTVERGEGEDDGKFRLTVQSPFWRVRLTCGPDGTILSRTRVRLEASKAASATDNNAG
ncbi:DUF6522 family protein [Paracoccus rhizosphaerae]|uniref:DUF6522 family protein n=2 Tax=Paracoccus rhizosphaerae TaxID=1133347 RepID=A0ABV6CKX9_9RHOB